ncbi:TetR family transcriptional regulator [Streptomyces dioscori]|uniref:TetR family transcriptional regulator n=2 Tax=Streptomyces dioscori TaxID=2109333 RepID=A0A2P8Q9M2_9ACTN|nr:TetR family transcriptional regulator [Streptomyces dioscori]
MHLFWKRGYHTTQIPRLTELLGVGTGSLYSAFGSKDGLYARALQHYCDGLLTTFDRAVRAGPDIRAAMRGLLLAMVDADAADPERGCLMVNAVIERPAHDGTVEQVRAAMTAVESVLREALERAAVHGELHGDRSPAELARFFTTFVQGIHVVGQSRMDGAFLESAVAVALQALD